MKKLLALAVLTLSTAASATFYTGNDIKNRLDGGDTHQGMLVLGYVAGVVDLGRGEYHCAPEGVTLGQLRDIAYASINRDPSSRHLNASVLVTLSLMEVWPCKKKGGNL
jgi:hypothetical protein